LAAAVWWGTAVLFGWLAFPIMFVTLRGLNDKGYVLARIFALLFISYFVWLLASLNILPHTRGTLALGLLVMTAISALIFIRRRQEIVAFIRANLGYLAIVELFGIALYLLAIFIRLGNPDVWDIIYGGEKPMDLAYFTAVLKSTTFPPYDPWYAGGYINYYYYGFVYIGAITKLLGIVPTLAYNLILPMLFSFTGLGAFSLAFNLVAHNERREAKSEERSSPPSPLAPRPSPLPPRLSPLAPPPSLCSSPSSSPWPSPPGSSCRPWPNNPWLNSAPLPKAISTTATTFVAWIWCSPPSSSTTTPTTAVPLAWA
jgi:hypothetical protein